MNLINLLRLLRKHLVVLLVTPVIMASLVYYMTRKPILIYSSETTLYTGIASGSTVEMDKSLSFFATNTAFDNLINVIKSRETQKEVAVRLLAQHLMLKKYDPKFISRQSFQNFTKNTPDYIRKLVATDADIAKKRNSDKQETKFSTSHPSDTANLIATGSIAADSLTSINDSLAGDSVLVKDDFSFSTLDSATARKSIPEYIDPELYELTVENLKAYMAQSDTNYIYELLNFNHPHYSLKSIGKATVKRIGNSDLVKLTYDSDDPGICKQTLVLYTEVCIKNYKNIKENRSDAVVKYFEYQVKQSSARLRMGEDKLLKFNEDHNIINYYEQSKAVAIVKENLEVSYHDMRIKLAGTQASIKRIEEKLGNLQEIHLNSASIVEKRNQLAQLNSKIAQIETIDFSHSRDTSNNQSLVRLKSKADKIKEELKQSVRSLYNLNNTIEGLPVTTLLNDWIKNVIQYEDTKAGLEVLGERIVEFQKQYEVYAPAGAIIKRIEREINVSEQEFLELLHGLNMAKLKMQDAELSASIKAVDPPFFPLSPNPTKRSLLIMVAAVFGFIVVFGIILAMEYFDGTLKNSKKAESILNLKCLGIFPKVFLKTGTLNFPFIANRLLEIIVQKIAHFDRSANGDPRTIVFFSTIDNEGKTVLISNIAQKLINQGRKVLVMNYSVESLHQMELSRIGYPEETGGHPVKRNRIKGNPANILGRLLGYPDTRVNLNSPFLESPEESLRPENYYNYKINQNFFSAKGYKDLIEVNAAEMISRPDYILIEIPNLLSHPSPVELIKTASMVVMVCRANHIWSEADKRSLESISELSMSKPEFILNGVDFPVIETVLGDLPKKRSMVRRFVKKFIRFQFFSDSKP